MPSADFSSSMTTYRQIACYCCN